MPRAKKIQNLLDALLEQNGGMAQKPAAALNVCAWCKGPVTGFKDALSIKEHSISGMCQKCQDKTFKETS